MNRRDALMLGAAATFSAGLARPVLAEGQPTILDMEMGAADAPVELIEYSSLTCPHCADFHADVLKPLKRDYIDTGKVRFVFREVYFDPPGLWAAMLARCGGEMRYFGILDILFDKQRDWIGNGQGQTIVANLRKIGKTVGLTEAEMDACLYDEDKANAMVAHFEENWAKFDLEGTPSLILDGQKYSNMSYRDLKKLIDAKLGG